MFTENEEVTRENLMSTVEVSAVWPDPQWLLTNSGAVRRRGPCLLQELGVTQHSLRDCVWRRKAT